MPMQNDDLENFELDLLLDSIFYKHGYDFRNYARVSLKRHFKEVLHFAGKSNFSELIPLVLHEPDYINHILKSMSVTVNNMFDSPDYFQYFRKYITPYLKTYPSIKLWIAGCASGEEVYTYAIILIEEGLYERCQIIASDINQQSLDYAREGIYPLELIKDFSTNYQLSGGKLSFSEYYEIDDDHVQMDRNLLRHVKFIHHNLLSTDAPGAMNIISCRKVLGYFNRDTQESVANLFHDNLLPYGFLCIDKNDPIELSPVGESFQKMTPEFTIFQKQETK